MAENCLTLKKSFALLSEIDQQMKHKQIIKQQKDDGLETLADKIARLEQKSSDLLFHSKKAVQIMDQNNVKQQTKLEQIGMEYERMLRDFQQKLIKTI